MKKLIITSFSMLLLHVAIAQHQRFDSPVDPPVNQANVIEKYKPSQKNKGDISEWYIVEDIIVKSNIGANLNNGIAFMYHDSLGKLIFDDGTVRYNPWQGAGHVLDPKDDLIGLTNNPGIQLSRFVSYRLDSIRMPYAYVRHVDSVDDNLGGKLPAVDTLFVFWFRGSQISRARFTTSQQNTAWLNYNHNLRMPANYFSVDTILLTKNDSTSFSSSTSGVPESTFRYKGLQLPAPAGVEINANNGANVDNLVAVFLVFKAGVPTLYNGDQDTAVLLLQRDPVNYPNIKRTNFFGYRFINNNNPSVDWSNPAYYNVGQFAVSWSSYGQMSTWLNRTAPTNLFASDRWMDIDFKLTTTSGNVGIADIKNDNFALSQVYPNPARSTDRPVIAFNLKQSATVNVTIVNLVGQQVKSVFTKNYTEGAHAEFVDINGLKPGVYFVTMTVNGTSISKKLTITE